MSETEISQFIQTHWNIQGNVEDISDQGLSGSCIFTITNPEGKFVLKGYPPKISKGNMEVVHKLLRAFEVNDFTKVPKVIETANGETTVFGEERYWEILTFSSGHQLTQDPDRVGLESLAESIAGFHKLSLQVGPDSRARTPKVPDKSKLLENADYLKKLDPNKLALLKDYDYLELFENFLGLIPEIYNKYLDINWHEVYPKFPQNFIHSDLTKKNILFANDEVSAIIDFESTKYGPRIWDIARIPFEFTDGKKDLINLFVDNYKSINPLEAVEEDYLVNWMHMLNIGVNSWALTHFVDHHLEVNTSNSEYLVRRIEKAIKIMTALG